MKKLLLFFKKNLSLVLISTFSSLLIGGIIFTVYFLLSDHGLSAACNGCFIAGMVLIFVALLVIITRLGSFDIFAFGFYQLGSAMFSKNVKGKKYEDYIDYQKKKREQRKEKPLYQYFIIFSGSLFVIVGIIIRIIIASKYGF